MLADNVNINIGSDSAGKKAGHMPNRSHGTSISASELLGRMRC